MKRVIYVCQRYARPLAIAGACLMMLTACAASAVAGISGALLASGEQSASTVTVASLPGEDVMAVRDNTEDVNVEGTVRIESASPSLKPEGKAGGNVKLTGVIEYQKAGQ